MLYNREQLISQTEPVLGQNTIVSQSLFPSRSVNKYWQIVREYWLNEGGGNNIAMDWRPI